MSPKTFIAWAVATAVTVVAAIAVTLSQPAVTTARLVNEPAFPDLRADPDAVAKVTVNTAEADFTLVRGPDGGWSAPDKFGYPVAGDMVRSLVVGLADMQLVEAKTRRPDRYTRLDVEDVTTEDALSRQIRVTDGDDAVLAEVILGKTAQGFIGGQEIGTYMRRPGEQQAWLASGGPAVQETLVGWLETDILDLAANRIARVEMFPAGTDRYTAVREAEDGQFQLENPPEGRKLQAGTLNRLASGLTNISLKDVQPKADLALPADRSVATFTTFDGVEVITQVATIDEKHWAVFQAREVSEEGDATVAAEAEEINARLGDWAFEIDTFAAEKLGRPLEDLLEKKDGTS